MIDFREKLNQIQDFVADPSTTKTLMIVKKAVDMGVSLATAKIKGPFGAAALAVNVVTSVAETMNTATDDWDDYRTKFMRRNGLVSAKEAGETIMEPIDAFMMVADLREDLAREWTKDNCIYRIIRVSPDLEIFARRNSPRDEIIGFSPGLTPDAIRDAIVARIATADGIRAGKEAGPGGVQSFVLRPISLDGEYYPEPGRDPAEMAQRLERYRAAGVRRAILAHGPPGSGKTTFFFQVARRMGMKVLLVDPHALDVIHQGSIGVLVRAAGIRLLILDDIDHGDNKRLNTAVDQLRRTCPDLVVVATANDLKKISKSLLRRLGAQTYFPRPSAETRRKIAEGVRQACGIERDLSSLADRLDHELCTHDYVRDFAERALVDSDDEIYQSFLDTFDLEPEAPPEPPGDEESLVEEEDLSGAIDFFIMGCGLDPTEEARTEVLEQIATGLLRFDEDGTIIHAGSGGLVIRP